MKHPESSNVQHGNLEDAVIGQKEEHAMGGLKPLSARQEKKVELKTNISFL